MPPKAKPCPELTAALEAIALLTIRIEKLEKTNSEQEAKITELQNKTGGAAAVANGEKTWAMLFNNKKSDGHLKLLNVVSEENKQRNKKEKNVIIFGLKESEKNSITEKKEDDMSEIEQICQVLGVENTVEGAFRLNAKYTNKPKPLVMVLKDREARNKFLQAAKRLRDSNEFKSVFLGPDLTEAQRLKHKELVKIRDKKNEKMSNEEKDKKIWCIRDNEVVQLNKRK
jgi:hypothetical protein